MKIKIILESCYSKGWPNVEIKVNDSILYDDICEPEEKYFILEKDIELEYTNNSLQITHYGKRGNDSITDAEGNIIKDKAIILKSVSFDNYNIPEVILYQQKFYPNWEGQPEFITNNLYFGFNGTYELKFEKNVKKWYYNLLLEKERLANINNKKEMVLSNGTVVESFEFTGRYINANNDAGITIDELYDMINK